MVTIQQFLCAGPSFSLFPSALARIFHELQSFCDFVLCRGASHPPMALVLPLLFLALLCLFVLFPPLSLSLSLPCCPGFSDLWYTHFHRDITNFPDGLGFGQPQPLPTDTICAAWITFHPAAPLPVLPCTYNLAPSFSVGSGKISFYSNVKVVCVGKRWRRF